MSQIFDPNFAPTGVLSVLVTASVLTSTSAKAAQLGPFRGIYVNTTTSFTITQQDNSTVSYNAMPQGTTLWVAGEFVSAIATATALYVLK